MPARGGPSLRLEATWLASLSMHPFQRVATALRADIDEGRLAAGQAVAPDIQLADRFEVSRQTVHKALQCLEGEGYIQRKRGSRRVVMPPTYRTPRDDKPDMSKDINRAVGAALQRARLSRGWLRPELVKRVPFALPVATYASYESGLRACSLARLIQICEILEVDPFDLLRSALADLNGIPSRPQRTLDVDLGEMKDLLHTILSRLDERTVVA